MSSGQSSRALAIGTAASMLWLAACVKAAWPAVTAVDATRATRFTEPLQDFRDAAYFPVREFASGGDPYSTSAMLRHWPVRQQFDLYLPAHLLLNYPLNWLAYHQAALVYTVVGLALLTLLGAASAVWAELPGGRSAQILVAAVFVGSQVGSAQIFLGQINPLVAVGVCLGLWYSARRLPPAVIGVALSWLKPQFGLPLVILLVARGRVREAIYGTGLAACASLPVAAVLIARAGSLGSFWSIITDNVNSAQQASYDAADSASSLRIDAAADWYRLTSWLPSHVEPVITVAVLALGCLLMLRRRSNGALSLEEQLAAGLAILLAVVHQPGDSLIVLPAVVMVLGRLLRGASVDPLVVAAALLCLVPAVHFSVAARIISHLVGARVEGFLDGFAISLAGALMVAWGLRTEFRSQQHGMAGLLR